MEGQKKSGIEAGDRVKVIRRARNYESGWGLEWSDNMDNCVSEILTVNFNAGDWGFYFKNIGWIPFFVLEKVADIKVEIINSSCPQCNGELVDKYSEYVGGNIKKCSNCGWC